MWNHEVKETMKVWEGTEVVEVSPNCIMLVVVAPILATLIPLLIAYICWG